MRALWPLALMLAAIPICDAAVLGEWRVNLLRGASSVEPPSVGATEDAAWAACLARIPQTAPTGTQYTCQAPRYFVRYTTTPPPTCIVPRPAPDNRPGVCPGATAGNWQQVRNYTSVAYPVCWTAGAWLPATPPPGVCVAVVTGSATFSWVPPTKNTDGTPLTNLTSYKLYYGSSATSMPNSVQIPAPANRYVLAGLTPGPLYARMTAVNSAGRESALSNTASVP